CGQKNPACWFRRAGNLLSVLRTTFSTTNTIINLFFADVQFVIQTLLAIAAGEALPGGPRHISPLIPPAIEVVGPRRPARPDRVPLAHVRGRREQHGEHVLRALAGRELAQFVAQALPAMAW